jgi:hypothetical protein
MTTEREALRALLSHVDANTCTHEYIYRGGAIWTICDDCGMKWADDEGGFKPYRDPPAVANARRALSTGATAGGEGLREKVARALYAYHNPSGSGSGWSMHLGAAEAALHVIHTEGGE